MVENVFAWGVLLAVGVALLIHFALNVVKQIMEYEAEQKNFNHSKKSRF